MNATLVVAATTVASATLLWALYRWGERDQRRRRDERRETERQRIARARQDPDADTHQIRLDSPLDDASIWSSRHGYRAVHGLTGVTLQRDGETPIVVGVGDTLRWDGERVVSHRTDQNEEA